MKLCVLLVLVAVFSACYGEEMRLLQFSEDHTEWVPEFMLEKLMVDPNVNFMDITDKNYDDMVEAVEALPIPTALRQRTYINTLLPLVKVSEVVATITKLSEFYTRYYKSDTGVAAAKWLQQRYIDVAAQYGRTDVTVTNFTYSAFPQASVIATIPGTAANKDNIVIIGGHLDSIGSTSTGRSPGADDDASGSATVLEVFRVLLAANYRPDYTLQFMGYAGEEAGLLGSQGIAADYQKRNAAVFAALQLDMTGYTSNGVSRVGIVTDYTSPELNAFVRLLVPAYTTLTQSDKTCGYACSDHASWNRTGYRSSFPFEVSPTNPSIHSANDLLDRLSQPQMQEFAKLAVGFAVELAGRAA